MHRFAIAILLVACSSTTETPKPPTQPTGSATPGSAAGSADPAPAGSGSTDGAGSAKPVPADAVACESDADCKSHACGPCNAGDVLTKHDVSINCLRNPCPKTTVSCKNKVCTVD